jgi:hypothetical protein
MQLEPWVLLDDTEYNIVWSKVENILGFNSGVKIKVPFTISIDYEVYDLSLVSCDNEKFETLMREIIKTCAANDEYIYALDWQHTGFRYNPNAAELPQMFTHIENNNMPFGFVNIYFPTFYPNGDYYFFIQKDFAWGCLGHPWKKKYWIFGKKLISEMELFSSQLKNLGCIKHRQ